MPLLETLPPLARLPFARIVRSPRAWLPLVGWSALAIAAALAVHGRSVPPASNPLLAGPFGGIALPLVAYAAVGAAVGQGKLRDAVRPLVAFGAPPERAAAGILAVATLVAALLAALLGLAVAALAHGTRDPPLAHDALTSAWVAALGAAAYAPLFLFGASFFPRGAGRTLVLVLDFLLGQGDGVLAIATPRAHLRSLLGGDVVVGASARVSCVALVALGVLFGALAVRRAAR